MRLFVGLDLPWATRQRLALMGGAGIPGARWVPIANFHLTLRFIGEVPAFRAEEIDAALAALRARRFSLELAGVGTFAKGGRDTALWVGVARNPALQHLAGKIETALQRAGLAAERRRFAPHVTLARLDNAPVDKLAGFVQAHNLFRAAPIEIEHFTLFSSQLGKEASAYTAEVEYRAGMSIVHFITHPDVVIDPAVAIPDWPLSERGRARMAASFAAPWVVGIAAVHCSTERKAIDGAAMLAGHLGIGFSTHADLGENDRSATGYLPRQEFEATADRFFAHPHESIRGWERAVEAQARVVAAVGRVLAVPVTGDVAIVAHGGVGALLLCHLLGVAISRAHDQPRSAAGGFRFAFVARTGAVLHGWERIDG